MSRLRINEETKSGGCLPFTKLSNLYLSIVFHRPTQDF